MNRGVTAAELARAEAPDTAGTDTGDGRDATCIAVCTAVVNGMHARLGVGSVWDVTACSLDPSESADDTGPGSGDHLTCTATIFSGCK